MIISDWKKREKNEIYLGAIKTEEDLMIPTLLAGGARNVCDSAPRVHDQCKFLRRCPDKEPRSVIPNITYKQIDLSAKER